MNLDAGLLENKNYGGFLDQKTDAFFLINKDGEIRFVNSLVRQLLGYAQEEIIGKNISAFIHPEDLNSLYNNQEVLLRYPGTKTLDDHRILNTHGDYLWMECVFINMLNIPEVSGIVMQMRDIGTRKNKELELMAMEERFRIFMNNLPGIATIKNSKGEYIFINKYFERFLNRKAEEVVGKTSHEIFRMHSEFIENSDRLCIESGRTIEYIQRASNYKGVEKEWIISKFPIKAPDGTVYIGSIAFDAAKLRSNREEVREIEDKFRHIFEFSPDAMFIEDSEGIILDVNQRACELQGLEKRDLLGKNILELTPSGTSVRVRAQFDLMWEGKIKVLRTLTWSKKGSEIPVEIRAAKIVHGSQPALLLSVRDVQNLPTEL